MIVLLDQFSRHIYRDPCFEEKLRQCDRKALPLAEKLLNNSFFLDHLPTPMVVFGLMPLRHNSPSVPRLKVLLKAVDRRVEQDTKHLALVERFRKTSLRRLQV